MLDYALLIRLFPSWSLSDVRSLTRRERAYWTEIGLWNIKQMKQ